MIRKIDAQIFPLVAGFLFSAPQLWAAESPMECVGINGSQITFRVNGGEFTTDTTRIEPTNLRTFSRPEAYQYNVVPSVENLGTVQIETVQVTYDKDGQTKTWEGSLPASEQNKQYERQLRTNSWRTVHHDAELCTKAFLDVYIDFCGRQVKLSSPIETRMNYTLESSTPQSLNDRSYEGFNQASFFCDTTKTYRRHDQSVFNSISRESKSIFGQNTPYPEQVVFVHPSVRPGDSYADYFSASVEQQYSVSALGQAFLSNLIYSNGEKLFETQIVTEMWRRHHDGLHVPFYIVCYSKEKEVVGNEGVTFSGSFNPGVYAMTHQDSQGQQRWQNITNPNFWL